MRFLSNRIHRQPETIRLPTFVMKIPSITILVRAAGACLILAACAKFLTAAGDSKILYELDPIFGLKNDRLLIAVGVLEAAIGIYCWRNALLRTKGILLLWIGGIFFAYRVGLWWMGYRKPCTCLGSVADHIGMSDQSADMVMKSVLAFLIAVGAAAVFRRNTSGESNRGEPASTRQNPDLRPQS